LIISIRRQRQTPDAAATLPPATPLLPYATLSHAACHCFDTLTPFYYFSFCFPSR